MAADLSQIRDLLGILREAGAVVVEFWENGTPRRIELGRALQPVTSDDGATESVGVTPPPSNDPLDDLLPREVVAMLRGRQDRRRAAAAAQEGDAS